ncbi:uncharacterized protein A1O9_06501 [Exophiala aquamarina CBS 119918]|uniref:Uncharacterized protein n=1 Tax=Exophiala aquamarina CBS 119918 TaxID=1182545 RepID=A0A072PSS0_9EURO|nr:uncharacterized protein A1O9_06501 [Exophiala aquamarina CBS 119918]KEF58575.1 hypothetical protein A1O9_06501 [Exophiala aquamarina CBS 119918]
MAQLSPAIESGSATLASNNPFRNRVSPTSTSPSLGPIGLATTTNPFLDASEITLAGSATKTSPASLAANPKPAAANTTADIFVRLNPAVSLVYPSNVQPRPV